MKTLSLLCAAIMLAAFSNSAAALEAKGLWLSEGGLAKMQVASCGKGTLCAKIVWLKNPHDENGKPQIDRNNGDVRLQNRPVIGVPVAFDMRQTHANRWSGRVYDPQRGGQTYEGSMTLQSDGNMKVTGCLGIFCQSKYWTPALKQ